AWKGTNIPWLDEVYDLTALMPAANTMQLSEIKGEAQPPTTTREKDKPLIRLTLKGASIADQVIIAFLRRRGLETPHSTTGPPVTGARGTAFSPPFTVGFNPVIDLQPPNKYQKVITAPRSDRQGVERPPVKPPRIAPGAIAKKVAVPQPA